MEQGKTGGTIVNITKRDTTIVGKNGTILSHTIEDLKSPDRIKNIQRQNAERLGLPFKE